MSSTDEHLTLAQWQAMSPAQQEEFAQRIPERIGKPRFEFGGVHEQTFLDRTERMAWFYHEDGQEFVLVPGTTATIGFDVEKFKPTKEQQESFDDIREELLEPWTLTQFLTRFMTKPRNVTIRPMLVERNPRTASKGPIDQNDPELLALIKEGKSIDPEDDSDGRMRHRDETEGKFGLILFKDGTHQAWRVRNQVTHAEVVAEIAEQGFRLPTSDEWEYLCAGGATTMFRWGDEHPMYKYPNATLEWAQRRSKTALAIEDFTLNWEPNCFGLFIATDSYETELVAEPGIVRGGDGGGNVCGGTGYFLGWLPIATAFCDDVMGAHYKEDDVHWLSVRRVVDLPE